MEDLIKREDAERYIYSLIPIKQDADEIVKAIKVIPSADRPSIEAKAEEILSQIYDAVNGINALVDRSSGEWIDAGTGLDGTHYYRCSHCGWEVDTDYPNCPYCTAKMKGADDES